MAVDFSLISHCSSVLQFFHCTFPATLLFLQQCFRFTQGTVCNLGRCSMTGCTVHLQSCLQTLWH